MRSKHRLRDLTHAIRSNDSETVEEMLEKNSGLLNNPRCVDGRLLLVSKVVKCRSKEMIDILLKFLSRYPRPKPGKISKLQKHLLTAVKTGNVRAAEWLLEKGGCKLVGRDWWNVDCMACRMFHNLNLVDTRLEMLKLLVKHDLKVVGTRSSYGGSLFRQFILHVDKHDQDVTEIAEILLGSGISMNDPDGYGMSPLHHSVLKKNMALVSYLVDRGANVNAKDIDDETPLHLACSSCNVEVISLLLRRGAHISPLNVDGETPFDRFDLDLKDEDASVETMVKEFAKLNFENLPIWKDDMESIQSNPRVRGLFHRCTSELRRMSSEKFYGTNTYYSVMRMSKNMGKLARLTKNKQYLKMFEKNLQGFGFYKEELRNIIDEAIQHRNNSISVESRLIAVFQGYLPDVVIRNLAGNLYLEDLPLE